MVVDGVHFSELGTHLADLQKHACRKRSECYVTFLYIYAFLTEGDENVGASIRIDNGLDPDFGLVEFDRTRGSDAVASRRADKVADQTDVRVEELRIGVGATEGLCLRSLWGWRSDLRA